jgi:hypothetical protein
LVNSRVPKNRQTENLGDFDGFQPSGMPTFQILRFAEIEINPCNSTSKQGKKKAEWRVTIRRIDKKNGGGFFQSKNIQCNHRDLEKRYQSLLYITFIEKFLELMKK